MNLEGLKEGVWKWQRTLPSCLKNMFGREHSICVFVREILDHSIDSLLLPLPFRLCPFFSYFPIPTLLLYKYFRFWRKKCILLSLSLLLPRTTRPKPLQFQENQTGPTKPGFIYITKTRTIFCQLIQHGFGWVVKIKISHN